AERRKSTRQKSFLRGCIYFNNRRSAVDCLIRDISDVGARLLFSDAISIPDAIELYIPHKEQTLRAVVTRRHGEEDGVAFVDHPSVAAKPAASNVADLAERVRKLETEIASLKRLVKRLKSDKPVSDTDVA